MIPIIPSLEELDKLPDKEKRKIVEQLDSIPDEYWTLPQCQQSKNTTNQKNRRINNENRHNN
jgi:hypothetical protein